MKSKNINKSSRNNSAKGLTLVEVLISIVVVALLAVLAIAIFAKARPRAARINCVSNLKQIGLAFRMWSNDNGEKFPWNVSTTNGGTLEFAGRPEVFRHYLAASNELTSPKVLTCDKDKKRTKASTWEQLTNDAQHISYFVGLDASEYRPQTILSGDRNVTTNGKPAMGLVNVTSNTVLGFTREMHQTMGNIGLGDGSAHQVTSSGLSKQIQSALLSLTNVTEMRLAVPKPN